MKAPWPLPLRRLVSTTHYVGNNSDNRTSQLEIFQIKTRKQQQNKQTTTTKQRRPEARGGGRRKRVDTACRDVGTAIRLQCSSREAWQDKGQGEMGKAETVPPL